MAALVIAPAEEHGFDPSRLERAMALLDRGLDEGAYPGAVALVARRDAVVALRAVGLAECAPHVRPMIPDTIFDLASITKVVAGLSAVLLLVDAGAWCLDDAVAHVIPQFDQGGKGAVTLRHLLTHTSGLPPWRPCYVTARTPEETLAYLCALDLEVAPGTQMQYSDLGMALIRALVERATGDDLPTLLQHDLFVPLGMHDTGYLPPAAWRDRIAATEGGNHIEQGMVARAGVRFDGWRERVLVGEVNDGNTHYALGGVSSHAGLFATASDVARFGQLYLHGGRWEERPIFSPATIAEALRPQTPGLGDSYGLGWRLNTLDNYLRPRVPPVRSEVTRAIFPVDPDAPPPISPFGDLLSVRAFGHTGFTGTSLVVDPARDLLLILFTNSIHFCKPRSMVLSRVRARWHNAVVAAMTSEPGEKDGLRGHLPVG